MTHNLTYDTCHDIFQRNCVRNWVVYAFSNKKEQEKTGKSCQQGEESGWYILLEYQTIGGGVGINRGLENA